MQHVISRPDRLPYRSPVLVIHGSAAALTRQTGTNNKNDGGTGVGKTRSAGNGNCAGC